MEQRSLVPVICRLSNASADELVEIDAVSNRPPWKKRQFELEFQHLHSYVFGARIGGELAGYLIAHLVVDEAHIINFAVAPERRGTGIGRALLQYALVDFWERGARWVTLEVRKGNDAALGLYRDVGFSEVGIREAYYSDDGEDALVMSLNLRHYLKSAATLNQLSMGA